MNDLNPELYIKFLAGVMNTNPKDHVPAHLQNEFVEAGLTVL